MNPQCGMVPGTAPKNNCHSLSLCVQISTKSAQKQVFLLIFRVKICRYGLGTKNKNVRHVEKNKISKNKKKGPILRKTQKSTKNRCFCTFTGAKNKKLKNRALYFFSFCHKKSIKNKIMKIRRTVVSQSCDELTDGRGQTHRSLRSTNGDQKY